jgi:hypothetical protein
VANFKILGKNLQPIALIWINTNKNQMTFIIKHCAINMQILAKQTQYTLLEMKGLYNIMQEENQIYHIHGKWNDFLFIYNKNILWNILMPSVVCLYL